MRAVEGGEGVVGGPPARRAHVLEGRTREACPFPRHRAETKTAFFFLTRVCVPPPPLPSESKPR